MTARLCKAFGLKKSAMVSGSPSVSGMPSPALVVPALVVPSIAYGKDVTDMSDVTDCE